MTTRVQRPIPAHKLGLRTVMVCIHNHHVEADERKHAKCPETQNKYGEKNIPQTVVVSIGNYHCGCSIYFHFIG